MNDFVGSSISKAIKYFENTLNVEWYKRKCGEKKNLQVVLVASLRILKELWPGKNKIKISFHDEVHTNWIW
jgi:hypothetical protein